MSDESPHNYKMMVSVSVPHIALIFWILLLALHFFVPGNVMAYKFAVIMVGYITTCLLTMRWWAASATFDGISAVIVFIFTTSNLVDVIWFTPVTL